MCGIPLSPLLLAFVPFVQRGEAIFRDACPPPPSAEWPVGPVAQCAVPEAEPPEIALRRPDAAWAEGAAVCLTRPDKVDSSDAAAVRVSAARAASLDDRQLETLTARIVYDSIVDGSLNARSRECRKPLVSMLVNEFQWADFDRVFSLLFAGFGGYDDRAKIAALGRWAGANASPRERADIFRAETRYWLNAGDSAKAIDAAKRMEKAFPDYAARACRFRALAHAAVGEFERSRAEIARARAMRSLPDWERRELLYLEAWLLLQDGETAAAVANLRAIVAEKQDDQTATKARTALRAVVSEDEN